MPDDLLQQSCKRVQIASLVMGALWLYAILMNDVLYRFIGTGQGNDPKKMVTEGTLDRVATVDEVARTVAIFAGPAGAFVTGQTLRVDGGGQLWPA